MELNLIGGVFVYGNVLIHTVPKTRLVVANTELRWTFTENTHSGWRDGDERRLTANDSWKIFQFLRDQLPLTAAVRCARLAGRLIVASMWSRWARQLRRPPKLSQSPSALLCKHGWISSSRPRGLTSPDRQCP